VIASRTDAGLDDLSKRPKADIEDPKTEAERIDNEEPNPSLFKIVIIDELAGIPNKWATLRKDSVLVANDNSYIEESSLILVAPKMEIVEPNRV
jgi:hypothetical protein